MQQPSYVQGGVVHRQIAPTYITAAPHMVQQAPGVQTAVQQQKPRIIGYHQPQQATPQYVQPQKPRQVHYQQPTQPAAPPPIRISEMLPKSLLDKQKAQGNPPRGGFSVCEIITGLLSDRGLLKRAVLQCFDRARGQAENLDSAGMQRFKTLLSWVLETPEEALGDVQQSLIFFDFDGSGQLDIEEVYRLVKYHLREYRKTLGGDTQQAEMPNKTLPEAGYNILKELGRGNQGIVHLAKKSDGVEVCVKALSKKTTSASVVEELQDEFKALQELACERIAAVYEIFQDSSNYYMVGEPYHGGDFLTLKSKALKTGVSVDETWYKGIFWQCFEAINFMQRLAVIHCDVKEPNIMLKTKDYHDPEVVLVDFGLSRASTAKGGGCGGTPGYIPPETINSMRWYPKGDIFSLGVTLMQVVTDLCPPQGARTVDTPGGIFVQGCMTLQDIMKATMTRQVPFHLLPQKWPGMQRVLDAALKKSMHERLTAHQILELEWFKHGVPCQEAAKPRRDTNLMTKSIMFPAGTKLLLQEPAPQEDDDDDSSDDDEIEEARRNTALNTAANTSANQGAAMKLASLNNEAGDNSTASPSSVAARGSPLSNTAASPGAHSVSPRPCGYRSAHTQPSVPAVPAVMPTIVQGSSMQLPAHQAQLQQKQPWPQHPTATKTIVQRSVSFPQGGKAAPVTVVRQPAPAGAPGPVYYTNPGGMSMTAPAARVVTPTVTPTTSITATGSGPFTGASPQVVLQSVPRFGGAADTPVARAPVPGQAAGWPRAEAPSSPSVRFSPPTPAVASPVPTVVSGASATVSARGTPMVLQPGVPLLPPPHMAQAGAIRTASVSAPSYTYTVQQGAPYVTTAMPGRPAV